MGNRNWTRNEYLITLDLYLNHSEIVEDKNDPKIRKAADLIGRTPDAVALRLANYRNIDPRSTKGMSHVSKGCREIWDDYFGNEDQLEYETESARQRLTSRRSSQKRPASEEPDIRTGEIPVKGHSRQGQDDFRAVVRSRFEDTCLLCEVSTPGLLQAGHILPWSEFEDLRDDADNGLLLCYTHHRAFDLGMFTITESHKLVVNPILRT